MQLLLFSDFHNSIDLNALRAILSQQPPHDAALTLGDISTSDLMAIKEMLPTTPIFGVCGNHDGPSTLEQAGIQNIHANAVEISGLRLTGFEGSVKYRRGPYAMYSQEESLAIAKSLPPADILISHDRALSGRKPDLRTEYTKNPHEGLFGITTYLREHTPFLHIHGHTHENKISRQNGISTIVVYGAASLTTNNRQIESYRLLLTP